VQAYEAVATELGCSFFDAGSVVSSSPIDGIHLDADQHARLGHALVMVVSGFLTGSVTFAP
jgi:hypothetical protein